MTNKEFFKFVESIPNDRKINTAVFNIEYCGYSLTVTLPLKSLQMSMTDRDKAVELTEFQRGYLSAAMEARLDIDVPKEEICMTILNRIEAILEAGKTNPAESIVTGKLC